MADREVVVREVQWDHVFSFKQIMRAFRIALWPPSKLILCLAAICVTVGAGVLLDWAFKTDVCGQSFRQNMVDVYRAAKGDAFIATSNPYAYKVVGDGNASFVVVTSDRSSDLGSLLAFRGFWYGPVEAFRHMGALIAAYWQKFPLFAAMNTLIALLAWAFFGGAACRIAAAQFARDERLSIPDALAYTCRRYVSLVTSPLALFIVVGIMAALVFVPASLVLLIPYVGELIVAALFLLVLGVGTVLAFLLLFGVSSLGLQWPAIGAEGRDAFDAVSRGVNYVFAKPWRYLIYTLFSLLYLCLTFVLVRLMAYLVLKIPYLALATLLKVWAFFAPDGPAKLERIWSPPTVHNLFSMPDSSGTEFVSAVIIGVFVLALLGLMISFIPSFLLTSQTIIYFLLRRRVDFKDFDDIQSGEEDDMIGFKRLEKTEQTLVEPEPPVTDEPRK